MDEFGSFRNIDEDFDALYQELKDKKIISFSYSADQVTAFVITIAGPLAQMGSISFGGQITGNFLVALRYRGSDYFDLCWNFLHQDYLAEKLNLGNKPDSLAIAELLNALRVRFRNDFAP